MPTLSEKHVVAKKMLQSTVQSVLPVNSDLIIIRLLNKDIQTSIETGSSVTLIRNNLYTELGSPALTQSALTLNGDSRVDAKRYFQDIIHIVKDQFPAIIHVVSGNEMTVPVIIGNSVLGHAIVTIGVRGVKRNTKYRSKYESQNYIDIGDEEIKEDEKV
ncbi:hypothetical protein FQR65_LT17128 [Abscondita terminalis]|nr:hypothetical protein FQR65_LT17128 [Abscondita terminalis]